VPQPSKEGIEKMAQVLSDQALSPLISFTAEGRWNQASDIPPINSWYSEGALHQKGIGGEIKD
jgi:hypothetical protein